MTHLKLQKLQKGDYPSAHRLNVNVLLSNITFFAVYYISVAVTWYRVRVTESTIF